MKTLFLSIGHDDGKNWIKRSGKWIKSLIGDKGAVGNGMTEFQVASMVIDKFIARANIPGIQYIVRVPVGLNLSERIAWINARVGRYPEPFAFEFHLDSATPTAEGASVWYTDGNGYTLAEGKQFLAAFTRITGLASRHVNPDTKNHLKYLAFVRETKCASLLIELGFISNPKELKTILEKGADGIAEGFIQMNRS